MNRLLRLLLTISLWIIVISHGILLADVILTIDEYPFGTEVAGLRYYSAWHYIGSILIILTPGIFGLLAPSINKFRNYVVAIQIAILVIMIISMMWYMLL